MPPKKKTIAPPADTTEPPATPEAPPADAPTETAEAHTDRETTAKRPVDRVVAVSRRADGTPDQTEGFVVKGDAGDDA